MNSIRFRTGCVIAALSILTTGCVTSQQARDVKASAFLGDAVPLLKRGDKGQVLWIYFNPNVDWKQYTKVIVDPVTFWVGMGEKDGLNAEQRKLLCDYYYLQLVTELGKSYTLVERPEPGAIRYSVAFINASHSWPALATISTVYPAAVVMSAAKEAIVGKASFVGDVTTAMKATDSITGEVLGAGEDRRVGGMAWKGKFNRWEAVEDSSRYWAQLSVYRLCMLQQGSNCQKPTDK